MERLNWCSVNSYYLVYKKSEMVYKLSTAVLPTASIIITPAFNVQRQITVLMI